MQNENPTTFSSDRPAQQGIEGQAPRIKHSTHQHHHDNDPLVGSYMGLEVADMSNPVEGEQQDVNQGAGDQQVPEGSVDKSSIFDRDTSQDESVRSKDESQGVQGEQDWSSSSATSSSGHGRQTMTSDVNKQSTDLTRLAAKQGGDWAQFPSSDLGQSSDFGSGASKDWEGQDQGQGQEQQQQQQQQQENWAQFPSSDIGSSSGGQNQDWALPSGVSQGEQAPLSSSAKQEDWAQFSSIGQSSDIGGNSSSGGSGNKDWDASQSTGLLEGSQGSSEMQGVDRSQWPQNQGVWNPSLQGDSSSADKGISQQYDAGASNLSEQSGVTRDEGPYGMDIQGQQSRDEGSSKDQFGSSSDEPLSSWPGGQSGEAAKWSTNFGSQSVTDQGQQDLGESRKYGESGDFSYGGDTTSSVGQGREQGLSNSGASSDLGSAGQAGESNVRDFGKGDFGSEQGRVFGDSAGDVSESNVHDFGRGDLGEQSKLSGDKSTFSADAEEKGWGQQEGLRKNAGEGDDRVHGMAQEDFI